MARKILKLRIMTPDGWVEPPLDKMIVAEVRPYPHFAFVEPDGQVKHFFNFGCEMLDEEALIETAPPKGGV